MATSYYFGHLIYYDWHDEIWRYADNHVHCDAEKRKCPRCGKYKTKEGYDPCTGYLPNVVSFCCGHGKDENRILIHENEKIHAI